MRLLAAFLGIWLGAAAFGHATSIYIIGNGAATITPRSTNTWTVQAWGGGQSGNDGTGAGGIGAGWAQLTSFSAVSGTPVNFSLGAPGLGVHNGVNNGSDTWFATSGTVIAPGGGSATTAIGNATATGGPGGTYSLALPGGGGAGNGNGNGQAGGTPTCANSGAGASGGGNGGGTSGQDCVTNSNNGVAGGNGVAVGGTGGIGGTVGSPNGGNGGPGAGGGSGYGDNTTTQGNGGNGGDDYDNGGGGAGGAGTNKTVSNVGSNGGTPGGGGTDCFSLGTVCTPGQGGWSVIKITYTSGDADQIYWIGSIPMPTIPPTWTNGYTTTTSGSVTIFTKTAITAGLKGYLDLLGVGQ